MKEYTSMAMLTPGAYSYADILEMNYEEYRILIKIYLNIKKEMENARNKRC